MKFQGIQINPPEPKVLVIPHNGIDVVFQAQHVDDYSAFDELVPKPIPVKVRSADGTEKIDFDDKAYQKEVDDWSNKRSNWMFIKSLEVSKGIEWDIIDMKKPDTWLKFDQELSNAGFNGPVIERVKMLCFQACGLDQSMIDEATERFLAGRAQESNSETSQDSEQ